MNKKKILTTAAIFTALFLIASVFVGVSLVQKSQPYKTKATSPIARLILVPAEQSNLRVGDSFETQVVLDAGPSHRISGVDLEINYNDRLSLVSFEPNTESGLDTMVINDNNQLRRSLRYVAVNRAGNIPYYSSLVIGTLRFRALANGYGTVDFGDTQIVSSSSSQGLPVSIGSGTYIIGEDTVVSSPSPSASASPSTSPTPTPPAVPACVDADADGNKCVDRNDFNIWVGEFTRSLNSKSADFYTTCTSDDKRGDGKIDLVDLSVWMREFTAGNNRCR